MARCCTINIMNRLSCPSRSKLGCLLFASLLSYTVPSVAATQCVAAGTEKKQDATALRLSADQAILSTERVSKLKGNVQLEKGTNKIRADQVDFNARSKILRAEGKVLYTACAEQKPSWFISAKQLALNQNKNIGMVKDAWLHIGGLPFLYLPQHRFDLSDTKQRKSGFLLPRADYTSRSGIEFGTPVYFNLAPNKDATFMPRFYEKRGLQLNFNGRYLYPYEHGALSVAWLDDSDYDQRRYLYTFSHRADIEDFFNLDIKVQRVSDSDYVEDLSSDIDLLNESYVRSYIESEWFVKGWAFNFQSELLQRADADVNQAQTPYQYQARPSLTVSRTFSGNNGFNITFLSQATQFVHKYRYITRDDSSEREYIPIGNRYHNSLRLDWSYHRPWFFFTPAATLNYTNYKVYREQTIRRTQPIYSIHSGLSFEKSSAQSAFTHILEPALYYLNVPRREQNRIPLFDTTASEFRFESLFFENRFNGIDRIGDADQVTLALSSRAIHRASNKEALRLSLGRIYYFRDPVVALNNTAEREARGQSPWAGEIKLNLNNKVKFLSSLVWDSKHSETLKFTSRLALRGAKQRTVNLYYRSQKDGFSQQLSPNAGVGFEQAGINFAMPINERWKVLAGLAYDFDTSKHLSSFAGFEYRSCCWGLRFGAQRRLVDVDNSSGLLRDGHLDYESFFGIEFHLRGIGQIGNSLYNSFGREIFGYQDLDND